MISIIRAAVLSAAFTALLGTSALGHSGGTNAAGCHTNHKTGGYHCHRAKSYNSGRATYCHVVNGENRCGYARSTCYSLKSRFGGYCISQ